MKKTKQEKTNLSYQVFCLLILCLCFMLTCLLINSKVLGEEKEYNKGWASFLADEPSTFSNLPLEWSMNSSIPAWIRGSYVKNGPSRKQFGDSRHYTSYLDSWGKLHKFTFNKGSVTFSGRMIETANYNKSVNRGEMVPTITLSKVEPKDWSVLEVMEGIDNGFDNTNVMLWKLGPADRGTGQYIAVTDYPYVHQVDPDTLAVQRKMGLDLGRDGISLGSCAHWRREVGKDTSLNFHLILNPIKLRLDFTLYRFGNTWNDREVVGQFPMPHSSYIHMFSNTPNYAVIVVYPVSMDLWSLATHNMHPMETITKLDVPTKIYLMDLRDGTVIDGFESDDENLVFSTHHMNAWEENDEVVFDLACNQWDAMATYLDIETMLHHPDTDSDKANFVMKRVRLDLVTKAVTVEDWPNQRGIPMLNTADFPIINTDYTGYKNRFAYGWISIDYWKQTLLKKDLENSLNDKTWSRPSHYPGEVFFIPRPGAEDEDDGVVVTIVFDGEKKQSYLLLLDGQTIEELNLSYLPHNVPFSFHGNWFPEMS